MRIPPLSMPGHPPFGFAQGMPFDYAQGKPFDFAQGKPFDYAQGMLGGLSGQKRRGPPREVGMRMWRFFGVS